MKQQKTNGGKLGYNLVKMGFVKDEEITALLSKQYGVPAINLAQFKIDLTIVKLVPAETARKYQIIPLSRSGSTLTIAMTDPTNVFAMDDIKFMTGYTVEPVVASEVAITDAIEKYYPSGKGELPRLRGPRVASRARRALSAAARSRWRAAGSRSCRTTLGGGADDVEVLEELQEISAEALARQGEDAPVVRLVNVVLMSAIQKGASDIHIEPYEKELRVRYRIDGILYNIMSAADEVSRRDRRRASRSCRSSTSPRSACRRTAASRSATTRAASRRRSTSASPCCRRCSARRSCCVCSTRTS